MFSMDQWIDIASKFGIPVTMLALLAYFMARKVWPFVTAQIEDANAQRKTEVDKFIAALAKRDQQTSESQQAHIAAIQAMTTELRNLRNEIRKTPK